MNFCNSKPTCHHCVFQGEGGMDANEVDDADDKDGETVGVARVW